MKNNKLIRFPINKGGVGGMKKGKKQDGKLGQSALENAFIDIVIELAKVEKHVYEVAYPDVPRPDRRWSNLTQKKGKQPRQFLRLEDAYRLSKGLGKDLTRLIALAVERVEGRPAAPASSDETEGEGTR